MKKILITLLLPLNLFAATYNINKAQVEFEAKGFPTFITIKGKTQKLEGSLILDKETKKTSGSFKVPLTTIKTGMDLRDDHMINKYLEAKKFPHATLTLMPFTLEEEGEIKGTLELHGVKKDVSVTYERTQLKEKTISFNTNFDLSLTDFQIAIPSFQGITVAKEVSVAVNFMAVNKEN